MADPDPEILRRLDRIQATLRLAFEPQISSTAEAIRSDLVNATILDATGDWVGSTALQTRVAKKTNRQPRMIRSRLAELVEKGALEVRGGGRPEYRRTGLV
jgi:hypothetical protein